MTIYFFPYDESQPVEVDPSSDIAKDGWVVFTNSKRAYEMSLGRSTGIGCELKELPKEIKLKLTILGESL